MTERRAAQPIKVLVSTATKDLIDHRTAATEAVAKRGMQPLLLADTETTSSTILDALALVEEADAYVGIFGHRYGYVPRHNNPDQLSLSEMQYRRVLERGIPAIICLIGFDHPPFGKTGVLEVSGSTTKYRRKLKALTEEMVRRHEVIFFNSVQDLYTQLYRALLQLETLKRTAPDAGTPAPKPVPFVTPPWFDAAPELVPPQPTEPAASPDEPPEAFPQSSEAEDRITPAGWTETVKPETVSTAEKLAGVLDAIAKELAHYVIEPSDEAEPVDTMDMVEPLEEEPPDEVEPVAEEPSALLDAEPVAEAPDAEPPDVAEAPPEVAEPEPVAEAPDAEPLDITEPVAEAPPEVAEPEPVAEAPDAEPPDVAEPVAEAPPEVAEPEPVAEAPDAEPPDVAEPVAEAPPEVAEPEPVAEAPDAEPPDVAESVAETPPEVAEPEPVAGAPDAEPLDITEPVAEAPPEAAEPEPVAEAPGAEALDVAEPVVEAPPEIAEPEPVAEVFDAEPLDVTEPVAEAPPEIAEPEPVAEEAAEPEAEFSPFDTLIKRASLHAPTSRAIPTPPAPYTAHPYVAPPRFVGRRDELNRLNDWARSHDTALLIEGIGGMGKSALVWQWTRANVPKALPKLAGVIWWNFHESDGSVSNFVRSALAYVTRQPLKEVDKISPSTRVTALIDALRGAPYLVVLDSVERLLSAYYRMDAPYLTENKAEQISHDRNSRLHRATDPAHAALLQKLVSCAPSKVVLISRLVPRDLQGKDKGLLHGVRHMRLSGFLALDALALLDSYGVRGDDKVITHFVAQFENHPLILRLLAGQIAAATRGDFDRWNEAVKMDLSALDAVQRRAVMVNTVLLGLPFELRDLVNTLAAFRYPVDFNALAAVNPAVGPPPPRVPEPRRWQADYAQAKAAWEIYRQAQHEYRAELRRALPILVHSLEALERRGMLVWDKNANRLDLQPTMRGYAFARLEGDMLPRIFRRMREYYASWPDPTGVQDITDLRRSIEIYHALIGEGNLDDAADFYREHLARQLHAPYMSHYEAIELLRPLFPGGPGTLPALSTARDQGYFANELALMLGYVGQTTEALTLLGLALGAFVRDRNAPSLCAALIHLAGLLRDKHKMAAKLRVFELARDLAEAIGETETLAVAHLFLLKSYVDNGLWPEAEAAYQAFNASPPKDHTAYRQAMAERIYAKILVHQGQDPTATLNLALTMAVQSGSKHEQRAVYALWGETALQQNRPDAAEQFFQEAIRMAQEAGASVLNYTGGLARAYAQQGRLAEARALLDQGMSSSAAAEVYLALGEIEKAKRAALEAYRIAWADGPPFSFWWELEQARKILARLGVPEPHLPPFDLSAVKPIPHEAEIRAFIAALRRESRQDSSAPPGET